MAESKALCSLRYAKYFGRTMMITNYKKESIMDNISIQLPAIRAHQYADVSVTVNGEKKHFQFRVEIFKWNEWRRQSEDRASTLRRIIQNYDKQWQLVEIGGTSEEYIPITFRKIS